MKVFAHPPLHSAMYIMCSNGPGLVCTKVCGLLERLSAEVVGRVVVGT